MNEGLNATTYVDGEYPTTTPYILSADAQRAGAVAGFIVTTSGKPRSYCWNYTEREMLHPVYGDFPRLPPPGEPVPAKPALLHDADDELYENFVRDVVEGARREDAENKIMIAVCGPLLLVGLFLPNEDVGFCLVLGAILVPVVWTIYDKFTKRNVVKEYKPAFARHGIEVAEVRFFSDFYTSRNGHGYNRDLSTYVVFSVTGGREKVAGEGGLV